MYEYHAYHCIANVTLPFAERGRRELRVYLNGRPFLFDVDEGLLTQTIPYTRIPGTLAYVGWS